MANVFLFLIFVAFFCTTENEVINRNTSRILRNAPQISCAAVMMLHNDNISYVPGSTDQGHDNDTRAGNDTRSGNNTGVTHNTRADNVSQGQKYSTYSNFTIKGLPSNVTTAEVSRLLLNMASSSHFHFQYWQNETDSNTEVVAAYWNESEAQWCRERFKNVLTFNFNST
ncbi:hypothetical protein T4E_11704 [Trichinella pseudospiralis]|uniref:Uncharacterized protein n=1 Tax=Trichinella pseudospiralis TaxID=6337 RepID=A0A0V0XU81_TRIPS|nr:hypothetical protein T4E_11704 [Trichinella pseudospiralis]